MVVTVLSVVVAQSSHTNVGALIAMSPLLSCHSPLTKFLARARIVMFFMCLACECIVMWGGDGLLVMCGRHTQHVAAGLSPTT